MRFLLAGAAVVAVLAAVVLWRLLLLAARSRTAAPVALGARPFTCPPGRRNCVASEATAAGAAIAPLERGGRSLDQLAAAVEALPGCQVVERRADYLRAECRTPRLGYVDDLELAIAGDAVHVRSASRVGHSDLGVNRRRIEQLRRQAGGGAGSPSG